MVEAFSVIPEKRFVKMTQICKERRNKVLKCRFTFVSSQTSAHLFGAVTQMCFFYLTLESTIMKFVLFWYHYFLTSPSVALRSVAPAEDVNP